MSTADFSKWLLAQQHAALDKMRAGGPEFSKHAGHFDSVTTALRVLFTFEVETDMAKGVAA